MGVYVCRVVPFVGGTDYEDQAQPLRSLYVAIGPPFQGHLSIPERSVLTQALISSRGSGCRSTHITTDGRAGSLICREGAEMFG